MIYLLHNTLDHIMLLAVTDNVTLEQSWQTTTQFCEYICLFLYDSAKVDSVIIFIVYQSLIMKESLCKCLRRTRQGRKFTGF